MFKQSLYLFLFVFILSACASSQNSVEVQVNTSTAGEAQEVSAPHKVDIQVHVPDGTGTVYVTGNQEALGPWIPNRFPMTGEGNGRTATLEIPHGSTLEFKFTLGSWEHEALLEDGTVPGNYQITVTEDTSVMYDIPKFQVDAPPPPVPTEDVPDLQGSLKYYLDFESQFLEVPRHVVVWMPPGYAEHPEQRYPVLYMHDGENLFDPRLSSFGVDWGMDEATTKLINEGKIPPIIIVGTFSTKDREKEYNPFVDGEKFASFLIEEIKPMIDAEYRTMPEAKYTGTMGSSAGGLISLGLAWKHSDVFTRFGCVSGHLPPITKDLIESGTGEDILDAIQASGGLNKQNIIKLYYDQSTKSWDAKYDPYRIRLENMLKEAGWKEDVDFMSRRYENTDHSETDWRKRVHIPLEFMFGDLVQSAK